MSIVCRGLAGRRTGSLVAYGLTVRTSSLAGRACLLVAAATAMIVLGCS